MSANNSPIWVTFSRVLAKLNWAHHLMASDYTTAQVDAKETLQTYFRTMNLGVEFERHVQSQENRSSPNSLTRSNFSNARRLHSQGWSYNSVGELIDCEFDQLAAIPEDASLFAGAQYDDDLIDLLDELCGATGIQVANATKLVYQKRPALVPILDQYARESLGIGWVNDNREFFRYAFRRVRDFESRWATALTATEVWLKEEPGITGGLNLSRIRIIDILAWFVKARGAYRM